MLHLHKAGIAALLLVAGIVAAQEADRAIDVNGDGFYSFPEVGTYFPDLTPDMFTRIDANGDGLLDMAEVAAAEQAGLMPNT